MKKTYQVSEMSFYHKLQSLSCTGSVPRYHRITGHHLTDSGSVRVNTLSGDLDGRVRLPALMCGEILAAYPVCQILGCKYSTQSLFIVNDKNAISPLGRTELTRFRDGDSIWDCKCGAGLEGRNCAFGYVRFASASTVALLGG